MPPPRARLSVNVHAPTMQSTVEVPIGTQAADDVSLSLNLSERLFIKDNIAISEKGVIVNEYISTLELGDLELGDGAFLLSISVSQGRITTSKY